MLADEFGTASNIKSRVNRLSVLGAITSVQQRLKLYNKGAQRKVVLCVGMSKQKKKTVGCFYNIAAFGWLAILHPHDEWLNLFMFLHTHPCDK